MLCIMDDGWIDRWIDSLTLRLAFSFFLSFIPTTTTTQKLYGSLIDVEVCRNSPYEILAAPTDDDNNGGASMYTRAFRFTETSKDGMVATAAAVGNPTPANSAECTMCTGDGVLDTGFRAQVYGIVTALADGDTPPMVHVVDASVSDGASSACTGDFPTEQNTVFGAALEVEESQLTDPSTVEVGDEICFEGFIMDSFCIERGTLLDAPTIISLQNPELHSFHWYA